MLLPGVLAFVLVIEAGPALAQPPATEPDIVVTAKERTVRDLAKAITPHLPYDSPLARFQERVCFAVFGRPKAYSSAFRARLTDNAKAIGAPLDKDQCVPNALVIFVRDGRAELADIAARRPYLLDMLPDEDLNRLMAETGPVRAWATSETKGRDGQPIQPDMRLPAAAMSRIVLSVRRDLLQSVVLIDVGAITGMTLNQLADYATMRLLSETRTDRVSGSDTILSLFRAPPGSAPAAMTAFDRAYLKINYSGLANERVGTKIGRVVSALREER